MRIVTRTWAHPEGWDGPRWPPAAVRAFEVACREAAQKRDRRPPTVLAWDDGRDAVCWYEARVGPEEQKLRGRCREIFGCRERDPDASC